MSKFLFFYSIITTLVVIGAAIGLTSLTRERKRLQENQTALCRDVEHYRTKAGEEAAAAQVLRLRCGEYEQLRAGDAQRIRELGIRLRRLEAVSTTHTESNLTVRASLRDTIIERDTVYICDTVHLRDTVQKFCWQDSWVKVEGVIDSVGVECSIRSIDTLRQIVHRVPRRFLCFRYGTKYLRQEIISSNPHTYIIYTEYIEFPRKRHR